MPAINTNARELELKNAVAGGLLSSPTSRPPATYLPKFVPSSSISEGKCNVTSDYNTHGNLHRKVSKGKSKGVIDSHGGGGEDAFIHRRRSSKRSSIGSLSSGQSGLGPAKGASALSALFAIQKQQQQKQQPHWQESTVPITSNPSASSGSTHEGGIATTELNKYVQRPDIRPYYQTLGNMSGFISSSRSMSYSGTPSSGAASRATQSGLTEPALGAAAGVADTSSKLLRTDQGQGMNYQAPNFYGLKKSHSVGKSHRKASTALSTRFRKLRQRRSSRDSVGSNHSQTSQTGMTSGESDTETATIAMTTKGHGAVGPIPEEDFQGSRATGLTGSGFTRKLAASLPSSSSISKLNQSLQQLSPQQQQQRMDPTLPPPPPIKTTSSQSRENPVVSIPAYAIPYGFGSMGSAPLSVITKSGNNVSSTGVGVGSGARSGPGSSITVGAPGTSEPGKEASSTTRFKEMIKRNVGLSPSTPPSATTPIHSTSAAAAAAAGGGGGSAAPDPMSSAVTNPSSTSTSRSSTQPWSAIGELLTGDESPSTSLFSVSRLTGRRKRTNKQEQMPADDDRGEATISERVTDNEDDEQCDDGSEEDDDDLIPLSTLRRNPHGHSFRDFLPHFHRHRHHYHLHRGSNCAEKDEQLNRKDADKAKKHRSRHGLTLAKKRPQQQKQPSQALVEARRLNQDTNVLLTELEPLPADFSKAFSALVTAASVVTSAAIASAPTPVSVSTRSVVASIPQSSTHTPTLPSISSTAIAPTTPAAPVTAALLSFSTTPTTMSSASSTGTGTVTTKAPATAAVTTATTNSAVVKQPSLQQAPMMASILPSPATMAFTSALNSPSRGSSPAFFVPQPSSVPPLPSPSLSAPTGTSSNMGLIIGSGMGMSIGLTSPLGRSRTMRSTATAATTATVATAATTAVDGHRGSSIASQSSAMAHAAATAFSAAMDATPLTPRSFLFKSYQNSKFQCHYLFRVRPLGSEEQSKSKAQTSLDMNKQRTEGRIEYGRLPVELEQACSQYFREADVTYRLIESRTKEWKEERRTMMKNREDEFFQVREASQEMIKEWVKLEDTVSKAQEQQQKDDQDERKEGVGGEEDSNSNSVDQVVRPSSGAMEAETIAMQETNEEERHLKDLNALQSNELDRMQDASSLGIQENQRVCGSDNGVHTDGDEDGGQWDREKSFIETDADVTPTAQRSVDMEDSRELFPATGSHVIATAMINTSTTTVTTPTPLLTSPSKTVRRENSDTLPVIPVIGLGSSIDSSGSRSNSIKTSNPSVLSSVDSCSSSHLSEPMAIHRELRDKSQDAASTISLMQDEQERLEQEIRLIDDAYWQQIERDHCEEFKQQIYGLEMYLKELSKWVEYEEFDEASQVEVVNDSRDTALFSLVNGDKTNVMWLESPSIKQKEEFLNWIALSIIDDEESDQDTEENGIRNKDRISDLDHPASWLQQDSDHFLNKMQVHVSLLESTLRQKRQETQRTMDQVEGALEKLEELDEKLKKMAATMVRTLESRELQTALQPSLTTGLTLAETVECKIRDVNERIVVCARIMGAARLNLNRLRYEIELEQRSIRHFRQYKIAIAIVSLAILGFVWVLSHRHRRRAAAIAHMVPMPLPMSFISPLQESASTETGPMSEKDKSMHIHPVQQGPSPSDLLEKCLSPRSQQCQLSLEQHDQ
ncbi:hypothetical protein EDD11_002762 [Mortierella claussenii]|nr:hypothetical protein EDD11_002762 [Mortierella claussenii]